VRVRSDLSQNLAEAVAAGQLDFAVLTAPSTPGRELLVDEIGQEPLSLILPAGSAAGRKPRELLHSLPYIAFAPKSWLGQQITAGLLDIGLSPRPAIELDSIDAIENLVAGGFGLSIVPQRLLAPPLENRLDCLLFPGTQRARRLALTSARGSGRQSLRDAILDIVQQATAG